MNGLGNLGLGGFVRQRRTADGVEYVVPRNNLRRVLAFRGKSIDDVVNDPIVKNEILGFYKLQQYIIRAGEIHDLERQWNSVV